MRRRFADRGKGSRWQLVDIVKELTSSELSEIIGKPVSSSDKSKILKSLERKAKFKAGSKVDSIYTESGEIHDFHKKLRRSASYKKDKEKAWNLKFPANRVKTITVHPGNHFPYFPDSSDHAMKNRKTKMISPISINKDVYANLWGCIKNGDSAGFRKILEQLVVNWYGGNGGWPNTPAGYYFKDATVTFKPLGADVSFSHNDIRAVDWDQFQL